VGERVAVAGRIASVTFPFPLVVFEPTPPRLYTGNNEKHLVAAPYPPGRGAAWRGGI